MFNESLLMHSRKERTLQAGWVFGLKYLPLRNRNRNYKCDCSVIIYI